MAEIHVQEAESVAPGTYDKVLELLHGEPKGKILDAAAGKGYFSKKLKESGFEVHAIDLHPEYCKFKDLNCKEVDLNNDLPYPEDFFDFIMCMECIEHIESSYHLLREFSRVIKKGGKLIITTPNILSIFSRFRYLLLGYYDHFGGYYANEAQFYTLHINPVSFPQLLRIFGKVGFELENVTTNRSVVSTRALPLRVLLHILVFFAKIATLVKMKNDSIQRMLISPELLMGEILILKCKRI